MKAAVIEKFGSYKDLKIVDLPKPKVKCDEVLVKVKAFSLNHLDLWIIQGKYPFDIPMPHIVASDASGVVEEVGDCVDWVKPGDEVVIFPGISCGKCENCLSGRDNLCENYFPLGTKNQGVAAEYVKVPAINIFKKPANLTFEEAAAIGITYTTMWHALITRSKIQPNQFVFIHGGASGVGTAGIQIAKLYGATVITTVGDDWKIEKVKQIGADFVLNYKTQNVVEKVKEITNGKMCDVVVDHVGQETFNKSVELAKKGGHLSTFGVTTGAEPKINLRQIFGKNIDIHGVYMGTKGEFFNILKMFDKFKPVIDSVYYFEEVIKAYEKLVSRQFVGKIVVRV